jgi:hypothetical protein
MSSAFLVIATGARRDRTRAGSTPPLGCRRSHRAWEKPCKRLHDDLGDDAVTEVLRTLRVHSPIYCRSEQRAPWGLAVKAADVSAFHLICQGSSWSEVDEVDDPSVLRAGEVVLLMTGAFSGHSVSLPVPTEGG